MKKITHPNLLSFLFALAFILPFSNYLNASGGKFWNMEKMDNNISVSYTFMTPIKSFANSGRTDPPKWGQGFELEYMHYFELDYSDNWRWGVGVTMPFYFMPVNSSALNSQLVTAFNQDPYSNTSFIAPHHNQWFAWGMGIEGSLLYTVERFSVEATLNVGDMNVYSPNYKLNGGSYVPSTFAQYFPYEGGKKHGTSLYGNLGIQGTVFLSEEVALFTGVGFQYMNPIFKKDLTYINTVNNEPVIERQRIKTNQEMMFLEFRFGITITFEDD
jgi:hypothetical protein